MSQNMPIGNLPTYNARTWTDGESLTRVKFQSEFDKIDDVLAAVKLSLADIQSRNAGGATPVSPAAGQIWFDTSA